jgi:GNAT superfamily N-acetyltransferase
MKPLIQLVDRPQPLTGRRARLARLVSALADGYRLIDGPPATSDVDMAVLPEHQRRGLGSAVLSFLLEQIHARAPCGAFVSLLADPPGRPLYVRHGFVETAPGSIGMGLLLP